MSIERKLKDAGITLPETPKPLAAYVPALRIDQWVYTSGQIPMAGGALQFTGKVGQDVSLEQAQEAARLCAINALSAAKSVIGDLDTIQQIVKVTGFVNSAPGFTDQPAVINGASEFLKSIFGKSGAHTRSAVGVAELPMDAAVEIEMIFKLKS
ncbi:MAG: RidA family protein [candidate division KSB1 bacterium]|jgi:enamine deaminase RidA (YjgF/YER057c/UK114 family)|nr:RidA family protein [candidate division KSB1 bacterium]